MTARARRSGGRSARHAARQNTTAKVAPYLVRTLDPVSMLADADLARIEDNAEIILSEVGVAFQDTPEALELWRQAGATVEGDLVKFPKGRSEEHTSELQSH